MKIKQIDKTAIQISKQEILDELIKNFLEFARIENNKLEDVLKSVNTLHETVKNLYEGDYLKIFQDNRAINCLPEEVFRQVEEYFFEQDEENEEENDEKILSFKKGSKDLIDRELEIVIVNDEGIEVARIPESEIPY